MKKKLEPPDPNDHLKEVMAELGSGKRLDPCRANYIKKVIDM
jgi:hypothetical protein